MRGFVIAGASSGVGKTVVALGVMEALRRRGLIVQPFKAGPDYIDPGLHRALLGRPSYNLDTWMMGAGGVRKTFLSAMRTAHIGVIEGVMGLYDGRDGVSEEGSTAHIAKVLRLPVVLIVDASRMSRSAGAVVKGFSTFDKKADVRFVVFNRVGSARHLKMLKDSVKGIKTSVLGGILKDESLRLPERHLGLFVQGDIKKRQWDDFVKRAADTVEEHLDMDALLRTISLNKPQSARAARKDAKAMIAVAFDRAFSFYYEENLDILRGMGAELAFFSPLKDKRLPEGADGVYLGGGYPELHARRLEANKALRGEIKRLAGKGMPVYAECGGLMYLGRNIVDMKGSRYSCAGLFPWTSRMLRKRKALGYREVNVSKGCPFLKEGGRARGHEFHYSEIYGGKSGVKRLYKFLNDNKETQEGYSRKNTLASYIHLHFASNPAFARGFVEACKAYRLKNKRQEL